MLGQLSTIWKFRHFWLSLVVMDLRTRYRRSIFGVGWSLMNPLMMTVVFCIVFSAWFPRPDWRVHGPYFLAGLTIFDFVRSAALNGCQTFFRNESYIRQCPLPLAIYTLRTALGSLVHFLIAMGVVAAAVFVLLPDHIIPVLRLSWTLAPSIVLLFFFAWTVSILASFMTVYFQDTQQLLEVLFQVFFFLTPIMYPAAIIQQRGLDILLRLNPIYTFMDLIQQPILSGNMPPLWAFEKAVIVVVFFGACALAAIRCLEKKLIFHL
jgi:lipopolysaccharide transport system permease protein